MIKIIIEYKLKGGADIEPSLIKLRSHAMSFPGFVGVEILQNAKDSSDVVVLQTWESIENRRAWEPSRIRQSILEELRSLLEEDFRVTIYNILPATGWTYTPLKS